MTHDSRHLASLERITSSADMLEHHIPSPIYLRFIPRPRNPDRHIQTVAKMTSSSQLLASQSFFHLFSCLHHSTGSFAPFCQNLEAQARFMWSFAKSVTNPMAQRSRPNSHLIALEIMQEQVASNWKEF